MSKSPNVLVSVGTLQQGSMPQQTYTNLFTEFNIGSIQLLSNADFYNKTTHSPMTEGISSFDIYGFMPGNYKYTYDYSIQHIVDFFQRYDEAHIVICDILTVYPLFTSYNYVHPQSPSKNVPFFIRGSIKNQINFVNDNLIFQNQLNQLQKNGHIVFHIADPLISIMHNK